MESKVLEFACIERESVLESLAMEEEAIFGERKMVTVVPSLLIFEGFWLGSLNPLGLRRKDWVLDLSPNTKFNNGPTFVPK